MIESKKKSTIGNFVLEAVEDYDLSSKKYSKEYHRKYGPSVIVNSRELIITNIQTGERYVLTVTSWRGDYITRTLKENDKLMEILHR